jgi:hypothetical protein
MNFSIGFMISTVSLYNIYKDYTSRNAFYKFIEFPNSKQKIITSGYIKNTGLTHIACLNEHYKLNTFTIDNFELSKTSDKSYHLINNHKKYNYWKLVYSKLTTFQTFYLQKNKLNLNLDACFNIDLNNTRFFYNEHINRYIVDDTYHVDKIIPSSSKIYIIASYNNKNINDCANFQVDYLSDSKKLLLNEYAHREFGISNFKTFMIFGMLSFGLFLTLKD